MVKYLLLTDYGYGKFSREVYNTIEELIENLDTYGRDFEIYKVEQMKLTLEVADDNR